MPCVTSPHVSLVMQRRVFAKKANAPMRSVKPRTLKKIWRREFFSRRDLKEEPFIHKRKQLDQNGDELDIFLRDNDSLAYSVGYDVITQFCREEPSSWWNGATPIKLGSPRAWVDVRSEDNGDRMSCTECFDAAQLRELLDKHSPVQAPLESYRQLIYIPNLNRDCILALANSAMHHQVGALRDALYKHIALKTSMRVHIPLAGFPTFRLEFALPRLALREVPISASSANHRSDKKSASNAMPDISFLIEATTPKIHKCILEESQFTIVIIGWDHWKWSAYAFSSPEQLDEEDEDEEFDEQDETDSSESKPIEDAIASNAGLILDVNHPVWDPRSYWLIIVESQVRLHTDEWCKIVHKIEGSFKKRKSKCQSNNRRLYFGSSEEFEWTMQALHLLKELEQRLSTTIRELRRFNAPGGDAEYFSDITEDRAVLAIHDLRYHLKMLTDQDEILISLRSSCAQDAKIFGLYMGQENNRVGLESSRLNREANAVGLETYRVTLQQTRVALKSNLNAVLMLSTNQIIAPVVVVAGYFSTQENIFGFPRNGTSFLLAILVVCLVLRSLNILTFLARRFLRSHRLFYLIALGQLDHPLEMEKDAEPILGVYA